LKVGILFGVIAQDLEAAESPGDSGDCERAWGVTHQTLFLRLSKQSKNSKQSRCPSSRIETLEAKVAALETGANGLNILRFKN
jgi:hypothetical protein